MISKEAFWRLCQKANVKGLEMDMVGYASDIAYKQIGRGKWTHGNPIEFFYRYGFPCIRYFDGTAFCYDLVKGSWFLCAD